MFGAVQAALDDEEFGLDLEGDATAVAPTSTSQPVAAPETSSPAPALSAPPAESPKAAATSAGASTDPSLPTPAAGNSSSAPNASQPSVSGSAEEDPMLKRAARFGIQPTPTAQKNINETKKAGRAERSGLPAVSGDTAAAHQSKKSKEQLAVLDPETAAKLAKRAERFGVIAPTLQTAEKQKQAQSEVRCSIYVSMLLIFFNGTVCVACAEREETEATGAVPEEE
jgi:hypothetical protein